MSTPHHPNPDDDAILPDGADEGGAIEEWGLDEFDEFSDIGRKRMWAGADELGI